MQRMVKLSVVVPNFNEEVETVKKAFDSLSIQSFPDFEVLVIDDSTNTELANACYELTLKDSRFAYIKPINRLGLASSLNLGIKFSKGLYIARFDSDDICEPDRFRLQLQYLEKHEYIDVVGSWMNIMNGDSDEILTRKYPSNHNEIVKKFIYANAMAHPTIMIRKASLIKEKNGPYRSDFSYCEDLELWLRLISKGIRFANIPIPLITYRQNTTHRTFPNWKFNIKARLLHISRPYLFRKILAIGLLMIWVLLPKFIRNFVYKVTHLK
jgi:glycosyltransferase involved in cell wall biosynthesis